MTTHKLDLLAAARDLFDELDPYAQTLDEVSCLVKTNDPETGPKLHGYALDPVADGRALQSLLGDRYFERMKGNVLCLGAGGAAAAIACI